MVFIVVEAQFAPLLVTCLNDAFQRIRSVADYQFGKGIGRALFPRTVRITFSRKTRRIRYIYLDDERLATLRPTDGFFSLSLYGARRIADGRQRARCFVSVQSSVAHFIAKGGDVFAKHVRTADDEIRARDEVIIFDEEHNLLAVGRALLSGEEMRAFKRGVAVKVRRGCLEER